MSGFFSFRSRKCFHPASLKLHSKIQFMKYTLRTSSSSSMCKPRIYIIGLLLLQTFCYGQPMDAETSHLPENLLSTLKPGHPRLIWTEQSVLAKDALTEELSETIVKRAEDFLTLPPLERKMKGHRLLDVSREAFSRITHLSAAFRLKGDRRFLEAAVRDLQTAAAFEDWNPGHFLDVAEMTAGLAIGYDWLYQDLSPEIRKDIRTAIIEKGLRPAQAPDKEYLFTRWTNNWNQVCNGSMVMGALAVADHAPELAEQIVRRAIHGVPVSMKQYAPDGVYPEGPSYWDYGTTYNALLIDALQSGLGSSFGLEDSPGFLQSARYIRQSAGPSGQHFNFSDLGGQVRVSPTLYWMARQADLPAVTLWQDELLKVMPEPDKPRSNRFHPFLLVWRQAPPGEDPSSPGPLSWKGEGPNPVAFFRSWWTKEDLFVGIKAGKAGENHGHMDAGSFVFDRDGIRWIIDPATRKYFELESAGVNLWDKKQESGRWKIHEISPFPHATLTINGQLHAVGGKAEFTQFSAEPQSATVDLTAALAPQVERAHRSFEILPGKGLRVTDRLVGLDPEARVRWAFTTHADIEIEEHGILLSQGGHTLHLTLVSTGTPKITVEEWKINQPPFRVPRENTRTLIAEFFPGTDGTLTIQSTFGKRPYSSTIRGQHPFGVPK